MATKNRKANLPAYRIHPNSGLQSRALNDKAQPRHVITSIVMHPEILVQVHTSGQNKVWSLPVRQAAINGRLIRGMCSEDALSVGVWYGEAQKRRLYQEIAELQTTA